ncbi:30S ribosomal protein S8 [Desulfurivibrio alkaliphilus]|uniref:Small ribosomal subunit protein uS8 n=1 Tax=Desulfurivibrio alkaliphilus (strain DSM 19089 / UNIQEM U267 / AHT2) TaxID=589865 RepID=D6Z3K8_DESAT|nr:30S ribosomal protein S8 [Desulfurivibrio alkaliphilus]ADH86133.1 ribosomal protein S8 [Desulfurivibrio alkaliphilus AHT 2]
MAMSDPLADMLTRIRNAGMAGHESLEMPHSKIKAGMAAILKQEGYIDDFQVSEDDKQGILKITLRYDDRRQQAITGIKRCSSPGRRIYVKHDRIPKVMSGLGVAVLSTSKGVMTDKQAREQKIGGELLCQVW